MTSIPTRAIVLAAQLSLILGLAAHLLLTLDWGAEQALATDLGLFLGLCAFLWTGYWGSEVFDMLTRRRHRARRK